MSKRLWACACLAAVLMLCATPALAQDVPDFTNFGFPQVAATQQIAAGQAATISASVTGGSITVQVPAGAFTNAVKFDILTGPITNFTAKAPSNDQPVMDFAFRVTDMSTGQLIGTFEKAVTITATSPAITPDSGFFNIDTAGNFMANPQGQETRTGVLIHPLRMAMVGWVITTPKSELPTLPTAGSSGAPAMNSFLTAAAALLTLAAALSGARQKKEGSQ